MDLGYSVQGRSVTAAEVATELAERDSHYAEIAARARDELDVHRYAEAWPLLGDDELAELADDIAANGQREPITVFQGKILDGRNRAAACKIAGVDCATVGFVGDEDEALAFVQSVNNQRRHQSKGSLAASWALSMLAAGKRDGAQWSYGESRNSEIRYDVRAQLGVIADHAPGLLYNVRDDETSLNKAYEKACEARDAEAKQIADQEELERKEAEARDFIKANAPDLAEQVNDDGPYLTFAEALAVWQQRNREEAERIKAEKAEAEHKAEEHTRAMTDLYSKQIAVGLRICGTYGGYDDITELMAEYGTNYLNPPELARCYSPDNIRDVIRFGEMLLDWMGENR